MQSLLEIQLEFQDGLFGDAAPLALLRATRVAPEVGFDVYRNNTLSNYREALRDTYPAVEQVVGEEFFAHLAVRYAREVPSTSGTLDDFGAALAGFVEMFPGLEGLPYLPDLARLEWAVHRVFHASDRAPLDSFVLAGLDADQFGRARLSLNPAACLVDSPYPILAIWNLARGPKSATADIDLAQGGDDLLVLRDGDLQPRIHRLKRAAFRLLAALGAGMSVADALHDALSADALFDFADSLRAQLEWGTFTGIELASDSS